jgi:hypothetical protein
MARFIALFCPILLAAFVPAPVQAEDVPPAEHMANATRIESDNEADVIRFYVKGQLAAFLDDTGLHIRESIHYDGTIADSGPDGFKEYTRTRNGQPPHAE